MDAAAACLFGGCPIETPPDRDLVDDFFSYSLRPSDRARTSERNASQVESPPRREIKMATRLSLQVLETRA